MKIIDEPQFGPMFRFNDANVYWALHVLSSGRRIGRKKLAEEIGVGEGSMRRIIDTLKDWDFIGSVVGQHQQAILVLGCADKVVNGMEQRDAGIKVGADGCTTLVIRDGKLMVPPDWNMDEEDPEMAYRIRKESGMTQSDALIIGGADTKAAAIEAAVSAALQLF